MRELAWAYHGQAYGELERLTELMALIANCHGDPKKPAIQAYDIWHRPGAKRPKRGNALTVDYLHGLREAFTKRK